MKQNNKTEKAGASQKSSQDSDSLNQTRDLPAEQTGHTPGPWKNSKNSLLITAPNEVDGFPLRLCTLNSSETWFSNEEREANARLIAVAPELLEERFCAVSARPTVNNSVAVNVAPATGILDKLL